MNAVKLLRACAFAGVCLFGATGCFSPSLYQTPRVLNPGQAAGTLAIEPSFEVNQQTVDRPKLRASLLPALVFVRRYGITKRLELAGSFTGPAISTAALMAKLQVHRHRLFDIALLPRINGGFFYWRNAPDGPCTGAYCTSVFHFEVSAIALLGWNLHKDATLVLAPGFVQSLTPDTKRGARLSIGLQIRITQEISIHPEVTYMPTPLGLSSDSKGWFGGIGIGARGFGDGYSK